MNLDHIISQDEDLHRELLIEPVRAREPFDAIKLQMLIAVIEQFHGANDDCRAALIAVNQHANRFIKPVHGKMMSERLTNSTRDRIVTRRKAKSGLTPKTLTALKLGR